MCQKHPEGGGCEKWGGDLKYHFLFFLFFREGIDQLGIFILFHFLCVGWWWKWMTQIWGGGDELWAFWEGAVLLCLTKFERTHKMGLNLNGKLSFNESSLVNVYFLFL